MHPTTLTEISNNPHTNHFDKIAAEYGLEGCYIQCESDVREAESNVYFVCGLDKSAVHNSSIDVEHTYKEGQQRAALLNTQIAVFKISGVDPLISHRAIVEHCQLVEFLKLAHDERAISLPSLYPKYIAKAIVMAHGHAANPNLPYDVRKIYRKMEEDNIRRQAQLLPIGAPKGKEAFYIYNLYDSSRGRVYNWFKCYFSNHKNRVSIEHLAKSSSEIAAYDVRYTNRKAVEKELSAHREIMYWMSHSPVGEKARCDNELGYGSAKNNDTRTITLCCDKEYAAVVLSIINKYEHPDGYHHKESDIVKTNNFINEITIPSQDYERYTKEFRSRGVQYCIRDTSPSAETIDLLVGYNTCGAVAKIIETMGEKLEDTHLYTDEQTQDSLVKSDFHDKKMLKLGQEALETAMAFTGSKDVEIASCSGNWFGEQTQEKKDDFIEELGL